MNPKSKIFFETCPPRQKLESPIQEIECIGMDSFGTRAASHASLPFSLNRVSMPPRGNANGRNRLTRQFCIACWLKHVTGAAYLFLAGVSRPSCGCVSVKATAAHVPTPVPTPGLPPDQGCGSPLDPQPMSGAVLALLQTTGVFSQDLPILPGAYRKQGFGTPTSGTTTCPKAGPH